ncbi:ABC transporter ATP-binding protein [Bartonella tamiae]|uniref:Oligopeptide/dipeptide ABC transporter, ATP-binding protein domain n=1 Tax=Bartonella tamiae Th239 TaxID=1094558 RepID=J0ZLK2_9HYPH|nr:oligopeptide/dipeptide ABC transporter ATP-binding protein [Bartonella tamiae]EJF89293.1 oligopeptide/dipeptide ABC transporter, ATP-binding protein domain [Bartonella tamiae Th239]EJF95545.1 oligopeptide/dipeptide ABC transporter, ATP-binding protein domain [Bartonella tamiae Th307]
MSKTILNAHNLSKTYYSGHSFFSKGRSVGAVDDISLSIQLGETLGIVGESGSGKSTLGRLLLGLENPSRGEVFFNETSMPVAFGSQWRKLRADMQLIYQDPLAALDRRMPIGDQILEPLKIHNIGHKNERRNRVIEMLNCVGLSAAHYTRLPHQISGGQRQRVVIARALITRPKLLICDEPVSALDVSIQAQVVNLLRDVQEKEKLTMVFISHDLKVVQNIADRLAVMYLGSIVEFGDCSQILAKPNHPYTKALVSSVLIPGQKTFERIILKGEPPNPADRPSGCAFHPRCCLASDICRQKTPKLSLQNDARLVACHHV